MKKVVIVTRMPLTVPAKDAFECCIRDRTLIDSICKYSDQLRKEGVEVFERKENIIATSAGYYCAFYESEMQEVENDPIPFKGADGRMKVELHGEKGAGIEDLATMVALAFIPNPSGFKFVDFKDGNPENVNAENLFWTELKKEY